MTAMDPRGPGAGDAVSRKIGGAAAVCVAANGAASIITTAATAIHRNRGASIAVSRTNASRASLPHESLNGTVHPMSVLAVYTDGACSGNPGPGGWAWAVAPDGSPWASGGASHTTNQRMEIQAALEALRALGDTPGTIEIVSDSTYVVNCFRDAWWKGWLARGWKNSQRQPVANRDLWEPLIDLVRTRGDVGFSWVKGHSGDRMNDLVDRLAVEAAKGPFTPTAAPPSSADAPPSTLF